jgi:hypothetical protein
LYEVIVMSTRTTAAAAALLSYLNGELGTAPADGLPYSGGRSMPLPHRARPTRSSAESQPGLQHAGH